MSARIDVAVGVVFSTQGQVLVAQRLAHQYHGGTYEFPGGKLEPGESIEQALARELLEEVGICVVRHEFWMKIHHDYADRKVCLHVFKIAEFKGEPKGCEGQMVQWLFPHQLSELPLPQANRAIVDALLITDPENL